MRGCRNCWTLGDAKHETDAKFGAFFVTYFRQSSRSRILHVSSLAYDLIPDYFYNSKKFLELDFVV